ncbi:helix-turn-helix domain-containing protein [Streptomyces sp. NPDC051133]|uniref:helix-turn-helix domain-containing protein n=1 Tax=Streptomyces sp. NPDC051133 TaxID=3155521 RepID=UPI00343983A7
MNEGGFGAHLRARRSRTGLTQEELAERSGLSVRAIRDLEHGRVARPRRETLRLLATALDLPEDEGEEFLRLARQALPPALAGLVDAESPTAPATRAPNRGDNPHAAVVPPNEPATPPKAEAAGHERGRKHAAHYGILLTALLTVTAVSSDHGPLPALPSHHGPSIPRTANRGPLPALPSHHGPSIPRTTSTGAYAARIGNLDVATPEGPSFTGTDLPVLHAVARGDTLIVTVALTSAGSGAVTVTDTAGNTYRPAGQINVHGRLQLFAVLRARPLDTLDRITIRWPRATVTHMSIGVDAFRGITAAGPWAESELDIGYKATDIGGLTPCSVGDLLFIAVNASTDPAPQFDAPWRETPWQPVDLPLQNPTLTTAYRSITSADDDCTAPGTATPPWESITLRLH